MIRITKIAAALGVAALLFGAVTGSALARGGEGGHGEGHGHGQGHGEGHGHGDSGEGPSGQCNPAPTPGGQQ